MKKFLFSFILFFSFSLLNIYAQNFCNPNGNLVLFTNYDGGILNINVDVNIPNLKIGVVSYEAVSINLSGAFVNNVTAVQYAGYNGSNNNCGSGVTNTSINGAPGTATTSIQIMPASPISNPNGYSYIVCAYSCNTTTGQGGCNTVDQVEAYFAAQFPSSPIRSHTVQYNCWSGTQNLSAGGNCCASGSTPLSVNVIASMPTCYGSCDGSLTASATGGLPPYTYQWTPGPASAQYNNVCPGTYTLQVTDATLATSSQVVVLSNPNQITYNYSQTACGTYNFNGKNLTSSGIYKDTLFSQAGCDSIITLNLTINNNTSSAMNASACNVYTLNGQTYTSSGLYTQTIPNAQGCDSIITLNLFIKNSTSFTLTASACNTYTLNNQTYTTSGTYTQTIPNVQGCDSIITLLLTIKQPTTATITTSACDSYTLNNQIYTSSGTYTQTLLNAQGCDSIITLNLTINTVDASFTQTGNMLTANTSNATYQWLDCKTGFVPITGEIAQTFTVPQSGNYALIVSLNNCTDTSICSNIFVIGVNEQWESMISIYPNPSSGKLFLMSEEDIDLIEIYNLVGEKIYACTFKTQMANEIDISAKAKGIYFLKLAKQDNIYTKKIVIE